ncbi:MAG TPA: FKBP-type peptidyl-prolyl cis-trans isomerase [Kofleriaceae bacterium]|nr:FKBP-type peptidyl-prolyl cis-trans isomerase [Kofleriaceae bacterium]
MQKSMMLAALLLAVGCQRGVDQPAKEKGVTKAAKEGGRADAIDRAPAIPQIIAPDDLKSPPVDALKTASGLMVKKLNAKADGPSPSGNDTVMVQYTVWKETGETVFSSIGRGQAVPVALSGASPGFAEALQLLHKGEKARLWVPAGLGEKSGPTANIATVYDVEVVDVQFAPKVPADVAEPSASAKTSVMGTKYEILKPGSGDVARAFDNVTFNYTVWEANGKMMDSSETRNRPATAPPLKMPPGLAEMLTMMSTGQRVRFWLPADQVGASSDMKGNLCFEVEVVSVAKAANLPPATPTDVKAPPANAKKTPKGVAYRLIKAGKGGAKPGPTDSVTINFTGWTTEGRIFDSSLVSGAPATFSLRGVIAGWVDGIPLLSIGDTMRFWIPAELAYKGSPNKPQGMVVFDIELLDFKPNGAGDSGDAPNAGEH